MTTTNEAQNESTEAIGIQIEALEAEVLDTPLDTPTKFELDKQEQKELRQVQKQLVQQVAEIMVKVKQYEAHLTQLKALLSAVNKVFASK